MTFHQFILEFIREQYTLEKEKSYSEHEQQEANIKCTFLSRHISVIHWVAVNVVLNMSLSTTAAPE